MIRVQFVKNSATATLPTQNHTDARTGDTGFDIYASGGAVIPARGSAVVPTGISVGFIEEGYWWKVESRSGLSFKHNILAHPGIIDNMYRGDTGVKLYNHSDVDYKVSPGDRIAQLVVYPLIVPSVSWIDAPQETSRGDKGFGSSGK